MLLPACLAIVHAANVADAAHDDATIRAIGLGWTGAWRALDAPWSALLAWLPVGTRATRATMASVAACGVAGGVLFAMTRRMLARFEEGAESGLATAIAAIASLAATLGPAWQSEAQAAGGATLGAVLALAPCAMALQGAPFAAMALVAGLAASYEPLVGLCAIVSVACALVADRVVDSEGSGAVRSLDRRTLGQGAFAFVLGLVPLVWALVRRATGGAILVTNAATFAAAAGERGASGAGFLLPLTRDDVGSVSCVLALAGVVVAALVPRARAALLAVLSVALVGALSLALGAPAGLTRYGAPVLAAVGATYVLAGVAMHAAVRAVARAPVPFARASAAMIVVLEATLPTRAADDTEARVEARPSSAARAWDDAATGALPAGAVVLVDDPRVLSRLLAERAQGELRADVAVVPLFDLGGRLAMRELARDPKLQPIWRDAALLGAEGEWSLSSLASSRPLVAPFDPSWSRTLARHLIPEGLFARFEPEPRGASDRRKALEAFTPVRESLARAIDGDAELTAMTATLLRARAIALAETNERDIVAHAIDDLRPFSPRDPVAMELVKRAAAHPHGAIDVTGLAP